MSDLASTFARHAGLDARGLLPIDDARAYLASLRAPVEMSIAEADPLWRALLSLEDASELVREARRLEIRAHPRGHYNVALHERYGDAILPWLADHLDRATGTLVNVPWNVIPLLLRIGTAEAFEIVLESRALELPPHEWSTPEKLVAAYASRFPHVAFSTLARRAETGDARSGELLRKLAKGRSRVALRAMQDELGPAASSALAKRLKIQAKLEVDEILAVLDEAAARDDVGAWPRFSWGFEDRVEYSALRLVAARDQATDAWGIALERITGCNPVEIGIERYTYGSEVAAGFTVTGPQVPLAIALELAETADTAIGATARAGSASVTVTAELVRDLDLRPGRGTEPEGAIGGPTVVLVRAALAAIPGAVWPSADDAVRALGLDPATAVIVACTDAFAHVDGGDGKPPSSSKAFKTAAKAIVARDPSAFDPGKPTTDWRKHARFRARG